MQKYILYSFSTEYIAYLKTHSHRCSEDHDNLRYVLVVTLRTQVTRMRLKRRY